MKVDWKVVLGFAISAFLLWWLFKDQDFAEIWAQIRQADMAAFTLAVFIATSAYFVRAVRWGVLLHPVRQGTTLYHRWATTLIGFMANNLLPARIGEVVRAYAMSRVETAPISGVLGTLVVARFLDAVAVFGLMAIAALHPSFPTAGTIGGTSVASLARIVGIVLLSGIVGVALLLRWPQVPLRVIATVARVAGEQRAKRITWIASSFIDGLSVLRNPTLLGKALFWSLLHWTYYGLSFLFAMRAFGIDEGYGAALVVQGLVAIGVAVPSAPGFFGTWHGAAQVALVGTYGVAETNALAFATAFHLGGFVPVTLLGLYYAWRLRISVTGAAPEPQPA